MNQASFSPKEKKYRLIILLLLIANFSLLALFFVSRSEIKKQEETIVEVNTTRDELQTILNTAQEELNSYKGRNAELDKIIEEKNAELLAKAEEIEKLINSGKLKDGQLYKLREEMNVLRYYVKKYQRQIDSVDRVNRDLISQTEKMSNTLKTEKTKNEELKMTNIKLENKMNLARKLTFSKLNISGINRRSSGRESETSRANRIDLIKVEFTLEENFVADTGPKDFYLKIVNAEGSTISSEQTGGGTFKIMGDDALYTMKQNLDFDNTKQTLTFYYSKGSEWQPGEYVAEIYADGFLIGSQKLKIR